MNTNNETKLDRQELEILKYFLIPEMKRVVPSKVLPRLRKTFRMQVTKKGVSKKFQALAGKGYLQKIDAIGPNVYRIMPGMREEIEEACKHLPKRR